MVTSRSILEMEHELIISGLEHAASIGGYYGRTFSEILKIYSYHAERESSMLIPLMKYLRRRASGKAIFDIPGVVETGENFSSEYEAMISEHHRMAELMSDIDEDMLNSNRELNSTVDLLRRHIAMEEEIVYPAAIAAIDLLSPFSRKEDHSEREGRNCDKLLY